MSDDNVTVEHTPGGYIASGSWEDLMKFEADNQAAALAALLPVQRELLDGRAFCWFNYNGELGLAVFGESDSVEESQRKEAALSGPEDGEPFNYAEGRRRGFAFSMSYSAWEPRGELGDVHLATLMPIERRAFEAARDCEWDMVTLAKKYPQAYGYVVSAWNAGVTAQMKRST